MPSVSCTLNVVLPAAVNVTLYFGHDFLSGLGRFDYLHRVRSRSLFTGANSMQIEETYWRQLEMNRTEFADGLKENFDLIVDAPSNSGYHRPYLSAFTRQGSTPCMRFIKTTHVESRPENAVELRKNIKALGSPEGTLGQTSNVLLVDDVFATGTIMSVVIEKLFEYGLPQTAKITLACPLRIPNEMVPVPTEKEVIAGQD